MIALKIENINLWLYNCKAMEIKFYNSLTNKIEEFKPIKEGEVSIYVCGPTVYNFPHIGNIRPVVFFDTLRKFLEAVGYKVTYISNFTDVDDKIINKAQEEKITEKELTDYYINEYLKTLDDFHVKRASENPRVSEYMDQIITYINELVEKGSAYVNDGEVFFDVLSDKKYGELSKINLDDLINGARIDVNEKKKSPLDFLLWKDTKIGIKWNSPWGEGRPGWHTECCVMIHSIFKEKIDIHGGGSDLKFPHHENEIAQSEAHDGNALANFWIHNAMMNINGDKMSKSLGNVILAKDAVKEYGANLTRLLLLNAPYRSIIDFSDESLQNNRAILNKIEFVIKQSNLLLNLNKIDLDGEAIKINPFLEALSNDMNIPNGITYLLDLIKESNIEIRKKDRNLNVIASNFYTINKILYILGIEVPYRKFDDDEIALYNQYMEAKANKNFELSDSLRDELIKKGLL